MKKIKQITSAIIITIGALMCALGRRIDNDVSDAIWGKVIEGIKEKGYRIVASNDDR